MKYLIRISALAVLIMGFLILVKFIGPLLDKGNMFQGLCIILAVVIGYVGIAATLFYEFTDKKKKPLITIVPPRR